MDEWTRRHHEGYGKLPKPRTEEEERRLALIERSQRTPAQDTPPGWKEPLQDHPGLEGEQRARQEAQRRYLLRALRNTPSIDKIY